MIENINIATKAEIQTEIETLEKTYQEMSDKLRESFEEWRKYVQESDTKMRELSEQYNALKKELNKREGKS